MPSLEGSRCPSTPHLGPQRTLPLDLLLADSPPLHDALTARQELDWGGGPLWIVSIEGLRALKRLRGSAQDLADLEALAPERQE